MDLFLDPDAGRPLTEQLYEQLRHAITDGRLRPGDQLVPSRLLASQLGVSRHTVATAYYRLVAEGYAEGHAGGGSLVAPTCPVPRGARPAAALRPGRRLTGWAPYFRPPPYGCRFDLRPGLPDPALFPAALWRRRVAAAIAADRRPGYGDPAGEIRLRRAIDVVAALADGDRIVPAALRHRPDVALLDIDLPGLDGLTAAAELARRLPGCRAVILTGLATPDNVRRALAAGVSGFLLKDGPAEELIDAVPAAAGWSAQGWAIRRPAPARIRRRQVRRHPHADGRVAGSRRSGRTGRRPGSWRGSRRQPRPGR